MYVHVSRSAISRMTTRHVCGRMLTYADVWLSYFTDDKAPALKGKLKLFVFALSLGHPVGGGGAGGGHALRGGGGFSPPPSPSSRELPLSGAGGGGGGGGGAGGGGGGGGGGVESKRERHRGNVLNSVSTGGRARVASASGKKRAELAVNPACGQDEEVYSKYL